MVVRERTEGAGDENVLPSPPPLELIPPAVALVAAFDCAASERAVSPFVERVGAVDFALAVGSCCSSLEAGRDCWLSETEVYLALVEERGVEKDTFPFD